jgi:mono/diheme cytochrome c family protein
LQFRLRAAIAPLIAFSAVASLSYAVSAQQPTFRNAPASASAKNPDAGSVAAAAAGKIVYSKNCAQCHGNNRQGMGPAPALDSDKVRTANAGELAWFITTGNFSSGMPSWPNLTKQQRWQLVTFLQSSK